jgi:hypothetical protein
VATPPRKFARLGSLGGALLFALGCDPNVVIGSKLGFGEPGGSTGGGGMPMAAGSAGLPSTGGSAGDTAQGGAAGEAAASASAGEAGAPDLPPDPSVIFTTGNEGSLKDWDSGPDMDAGGYYADPGVPLPQYTTEQHHSGEGAAKVFINADGSTDKISRLYRRIGDYEEAYYLAWFYLKEDHVPSSWWSVFLFRANQNRADSTDLWSIDLVRTPQDQLTVALYEHQYDNGAGKQPGRTVSASTQLNVPVGVWFQLQAYLKAKAGQPSQLRIYLDGTEIINLQNTTAAPDGMSLYWVIGNGAGKLSPAESTVYIDDAQIATTFVRP